MENHKNESFNRKLFTDHLLLTFAIVAVFWGLCIVLGLNGITIKTHAWMNLPWMLGAFSTTIASYVALKKNGSIDGFKDWLRNAFDFKHGIWAYLLAILFPVLHLSIMCLLDGYEKAFPLYMIVPMLPAMMVGGGLEEAGWRYITFPELDKKFGFVFSTLITTVIWWLWHLPLFLIPGTGQYQQNFLVYGIQVLGLSFMMSTIRKLTGSVWLCALCHSMVNTLLNIYMFNLYGSYVAGTITTTIIIAVSMILLLVSKKKNLFK